MAPLVAAAHAQTCDNACGPSAGTGFRSRAIELMLSLLTKTTAPDLGNQIHEQHPRLLQRKTPDDRTDQGGNYWTLFTPRIWKVLHAILQAEEDGFTQMVFFHAV